MVAGRVFLFAVAVILFIDSAHSWIPRVINGRPKGGKLRAPRTPPGVKTPPPMWFEAQRLDHFDGSNYQLWKQVYLSLCLPACLFVFLSVRIKEAQYLLAFFINL